MASSDSIRNEIKYDSQPPFSLHSASISRILEPSPQGIISMLNNLGSSNLNSIERNKNFSDIPIAILALVFCM